MNPPGHPPKAPVFVMKYLGPGTFPHGSPLFVKVSPETLNPEIYYYEITLTCNFKTGVAKKEVELLPVIGQKAQAAKEFALPCWCSAKHGKHLVPEPFTILDYCWYRWQEVIIEDAEGIIHQRNGCSRHDLFSMAPWDGIRTGIPQPKHLLVAPKGKKKAKK